MNKKFKRALSSVLAFVMLCSCIAVANVSSVFAADSDTTEVYDFGGESVDGVASSVDKTVYAKWGIESGTNAASSSNYTANNLTFVSDGSARIYWGQSVSVGGTTYKGYFHSNGQRTKGNYNRSIKIAAEADRLISVVANSTVDGAGIEINNLTVTSETYDAELDTTGATYTYVTKNAGTFVINGYGQKANIYRIVVTDAPKVTPTYTIDGSAVESGTVEIDDTEYAIGDTLALAEGDYKVVYTNGTSTYTGTLTVDGENTEPEVELTLVKTTSISLNFINGNIISSTSQANYYITEGVASTTETDDYDVYLQAVKSHNSGYGIYGQPTIVFNDVETPCKITIGMNDYGNVLAASASGDGEFADADGVVNTKFSTNGGKYASDTSNVKTIYFTGTGTQDITLTAAGTIYIPYLGLETIFEEDIPELIYGNLNVSVNVTGAEDDDLVELIDSDGNEFVATLTDGVADFSGNVVMLGAATVRISGYEDNTLTIDSDTTVYNVEVTATATESVPSGSDTDNLYVGYLATDGYTTYNTVQKAVDVAQSGDTIVIADGTYHEVYGVTVKTDSLTIKSANSDASKVIIWDDDNELAANAKGFHGDTLLVNAADFTAENITIKNTAEKTQSCTKNATALGINSKNAATSASATFDNCNFLATRDTIYTGTQSGNTEVTFNNCYITGFQDVICGSGTVTLNDCTMNPSNDSDDVYFTNNTARLTAPRGGNSDTTVYTFNNLTIKATDADSSTNPIYFGRPWNESNTDSILVINGYTIDSSAASRFTAATDKGSFGFSPDGISKTGATENYFWIARATKDTGNYQATLSTVSGANNIVSVVTDTNDTTANRIVGLVESAFVTSDNVSFIGFAVYKSDGTFIGNLSEDTVYENEGSYYFVSLVDNTNSTSDTYSFKPYVKYSNYDVEGSTADDITLKIGA